MTTRWQRAIEQSWESPTRVYKMSKEQKSSIPGGHWFELGLRVKDSSPRTSMNLIYNSNAKSQRNDMSSKMNSFQHKKSGSEDVKSQLSVASLSWPHPISDPNVCNRTICLSPGPLKMGTEMPPMRSKAAPPPLFGLREGINQSLCVPTVKYTQLAWKKRKFSFCYSTDTKGNSLADLG